MVSHSPSPQKAVVQIGALPILTRVTIPSEQTVSRDQWIVCQTGRGLEMGRICDVDSGRTAGRSLGQDSSGSTQFLRIASDSDLLAMSRLENRKPEGLEACCQWLADQQCAALLLDVDITLDGQRLYFHFLEDGLPLPLSLESDLADVFDQATGIRQFTSAVSTGCGPDCGSDGSGCSQSGGCQPAGGGCGSCGLKSNCGSRH